MMSRCGGRGCRHAPCATVDLLTTFPHASPCSNSASTTIDEIECIFEGNATPPASTAGTFFELGTVCHVQSEDS